MIEVIKTSGAQDIVTIPMGNMKPLQVGKIVGGCRDGQYVMRTQCADYFEVMNLSDSGRDHCWSNLGRGNGLKVKLLGHNESVTLKISNG